MKAPIIADNRGDLHVFESVDQAERYIEPIDVKNNEWTIYDSEGRSVEAVITRRWGFPERVVLTARDQIPRHSNELRSRLITFLTRIGKVHDGLAELPLERLIEEARSSYVKRGSGDEI